MFLSILCTIFRVIGWLLLAVLAILLLAMFVPLSANIACRNDETTVDAQILFFHIPILPERPKKKTKKKKEKKKPKPADEKKPTKKKKRKPLITLQFVLEMLESAGWMMKRFFKGLWFKELRLCWVVHSGDAAATAIDYGKTSAALYAAEASMQNLFNLRVEEFRVLPNFAGEQEAEKHFSCKITARLYIIVVIGIYALVYVLPKLRKARLI